MALITKNKKNKRKKTAKNVYYDGVHYSEEKDLTPEELNEFKEDFEKLKRTVSYRINDSFIENESRSMHK